MNPDGIVIGWRQMLGWLLLPAILAVHCVVHHEMKERASQYASVDCTSIQTKCACSSGANKTMEMFEMSVPFR